MAYTDKNFKTKKELKESVLRGNKIMIYNPSGMFPPKTDGIESIKGPHYPQPHSWYARVQIENGVIVKVLN